MNNCRLQLFRWPAFSCDLDSPLALNQDHLLKTPKKKNDSADEVLSALGGGYNLIIYSRSSVVVYPVICFYVNDFAEGRSQDQARTTGLQPLDQKGDRFHRFSFNFHSVFILFPPSCLICLWWTSLVDQTCLKYRFNPPHPPPPHVKSKKVISSV